MLATGLSTIERSTILADLRINDGKLALVDVPAFSGRTIEVIGTGTSAASSAQLQIPWTGTFDGNTIELRGTTNSPSGFVPLAGAAPPTATLTIGAQSLVHTGGTGGGAGQIGTTSNSLVAQGTVSARSGQRLDVLARNLDNQGTFEATDGGRLLVDVANVSGFANRVGGTISGPNVLNATLHHGTWIATNGGSIDLLRTTIAKNAADVILRGPATLFPALAPLNQNAGRLEMLAGFDFLTAGAFSNSGLLRLGDGSDLNVTGGTNFATTSELAIVLGGTGVDQFGQLASTGAVGLGGSLAISLASGFELHPNDTFLIVSGSSIGGAFSSVVFPSAPPGTQVELVVDSTSVRVHVTPEPSSAAALLGLGTIVARRRRHNRRAETFDAFRR